MSYHNQICIMINTPTDMTSDINKLKVWWLDVKSQTIKINIKKAIPVYRLAVYTTAKSLFCITVTRLMVSSVILYDYKQNKFYQADKLPVFKDELYFQ